MNAPNPSARLRPFRPQPFGRYTLLSHLATGGMGEIYLARLEGAQGFEKLCVIKKILPQLAADTDFVERFVGEARTLVHLSHGSIAQVLDMGLHEGEAYMALEHVDGKDLRKVAARVRDRQVPLPLTFILFVMGRVLDALAYAHRKKDDDGEELRLVHRDISPQNILISYEGEVKVIDFGLAKSRLSAAKTNPSIILGKFLYMSPEQARHQPVDRRSDLYAVGLCLYELICGKNPFDAVHPSELMTVVASPKIPPLDEVEPLTPRPVTALVAKALAVEPSQRFQTAEEFRGRLQSCLMEIDASAGPESVSRFMRELFAADFQSERRLLASLKEVPRVAASEVRSPSSTLDEVQAVRPMGPAMLPPKTIRLDGPVEPLSFRPTPRSRDGGPVDDGETRPGVMVDESTRPAFPLEALEEEARARAARQAAPAPSPDAAPSVEVRPEAYVRSGPPEPAPAPAPAAVAPAPRPPTLTREVPMAVLPPEAIPPALFEPTPATPSPHLTEPSLPGVAPGSPSPELPWADPGSVPGPSSAAMVEPTEPRAEPLRPSPSPAEPPRAASVPPPPAAPVRPAMAPPPGAAAAPRLPPAPVPPTASARPAAPVPSPAPAPVAPPAGMPPRTGAVMMPAVSVGPSSPPPPPRTASMTAMPAVVAPAPGAPPARPAPPASELDVVPGVMVAEEDLSRELSAPEDAPGTDASALPVVTPEQLGHDEDPERLGELDTNPRITLPSRELLHEDTQPRVVVDLDRDTNPRAAVRHDDTQPRVVLDEALLRDVAGAAVEQEEKSNPSRPRTSGAGRRVRTSSAGVASPAAPRRTGSIPVVRAPAPRVEVSRDDDEDIDVRIAMGSQDETRRTAIPVRPNAPSSVPVSEAPTAQRRALEDTRRTALPSGSQRQMPVMVAVGLLALLLLAAMAMLVLSPGQDGGADPQPPLEGEPTALQPAPAGRPKPSPAGDGAEAPPAAAGAPAARAEAPPPSAPPPSAQAVPAVATGTAEGTGSTLAVEPAKGPGSAGAVVEAVAALPEPARGPEAPPVDTGSQADAGDTGAGAAAAALAAAAPTAGTAPAEAPPATAEAPAAAPDAGVAAAPPEAVEELALAPLAVKAAAPAKASTRSASSKRFPKPKKPLTIRTSKDPYSGLSELQREWRQTDELYTQLSNAYGCDSLKVLCSRYEGMKSKMAEVGSDEALETLSRVKKLKSDLQKKQKELAPY